MRPRNEQHVHLRRNWCLTLSTTRLVKSFAVLSRCVASLLVASLLLIPVAARAEVEFLCAPETQLHACSAGDLGRAIQEGILWRPVLDVSDPQRSAVVLNRVLSLSPDTFAEEPGRMLEGFKSTAYGRGVRTLCAMGEVTLVDGLRSPVLSAAKANAVRSKHRKRSKPSDEE